MRLGRRMVLASSLLGLTVGLAFAVMIWAIAEQRDSARLARHTDRALSLANGVERLFVDLETGQRGFIITGEERFLEPWNAARVAFPRQAQILDRLVRGDPVQARRARRIVRAGTSYIRDYSIPLVEAARRGEAWTRSVAATEEGKRRVDAIRAEFDRFLSTEEGLARRRQARAESAARLAVLGAVGGLSGSLLLILLFGGYLTRAIVGPVRRGAAMAAQLAGGRLEVRMPETGPGEIGELERSFNIMAANLQQDREELRRLAEEQGALRRVATLVARGVPPPDLFAAVVDEVATLLSVDYADLARYEPNGTVTGLAGWSREGEPMPLGPELSLEGESAIASVLRTGHTARMDDYSAARGPVAASARAMGVRSSVASPIVVDGRVWGAIRVASRGPEPLSSDTEERLAGFTELVATAISNAQARADLAASRARIVAAADHARRQIERDLHDGTQQRLVSLGLELRGARAMVPDGLAEVRTRLARVGRGLDGVLEDLREISRGIHPAILSEGGLGPALRALGRRSTLPVDLDVRIEERLPEPVEVGAYYVASEALANASKHARATRAWVDAEVRDGVLHLSVGDDGVGGADPSQGTGLQGLRDRVEALGGTIEVVSAPGSGTTVALRLPVAR